MGSPRRAAEAGAEGVDVVDQLGWLVHLELVADQRDVHGQLIERVRPGVCSVQLGSAR